MHYEKDYNIFSNDSGLLEKHFITLTCACQVSQVKCAIDKTIIDDSYGQNES